MSAIISTALFDALRSAGLLPEHDVELELVQLDAPVGEPCVLRFWYADRRYTKVRVAWRPLFEALQGSYFLREPHVWRRLRIGADVAEPVRISLFGYADHALIDVIESGALKIATTNEESIVK